MVLNAALIDMLGEELASAITDAQTRVADDTVMAGCTEGLWHVDRGGVEIASGLTHAEAVTHLQGLS